MGVKVPVVAIEDCSLSSWTESRVTPTRDWPHRPIGPVVLLEDILHTVLTSIREHHDHLIAVGPSDVGLCRGPVWSQVALSFYHLGAVSPSPGRPGLLVPTPCPQ